MGEQFPVRNARGVAFLVNQVLEVDDVADGPTADRRPRPTLQVCWFLPLQSSPSRAGLPVIHDRAAGIDIGARLHVVAVPQELCDESVQTFQTFAGDIERMADRYLRR